jgi:hypothetical protein
MSTPFVFMTKHTINDGELDAVRALGERFAAVAESETGVLSFSLHFDVDGTEVSNVQVHQDAASMDAYLPVVQELIGEALERTRTREVEVFGQPGPLLAEVLEHNRQLGATVTVRPDPVSGFVRAA